MVRWSSGDGAHRHSLAITTAPEQVEDDGEIELAAREPMINSVCRTQR